MNFFSILYIFFLLTYWIWPIMFARNLLRCIKGIVDHEEYEPYAGAVSFSLVMICAIPLSAALFL